MHQKPSGVRIDMAYTTIDDPSAHFQTTLYSGTGSSQAITNGGNSDLQPDLIWIKNRANTHDHVLMDSTRGVTKRVAPNTTDAEETSSNYVSAFSSDGFTVVSEGAVNASSSGEYVAWQWKANGSTTSSNTTGDINTTVQVNSDAGFSIITYTGNNTDDQTIGHGLGAVPEFAVFKSRAGAAGTGNWSITHSAFSGTEYIFFTDAAKASANNNFKSTPTSTIFTLGDSDVNEAETILCYAWTPIQGYSKFGSYTGNGNTDGIFVYLGFKPAFLIIKKTSGTQHWQMRDNKRDTYNEDSDELLFTSTNGATTTSGNNIADFVSNGFKLRGTGADHNEDGGTFIYMAFAEQPLVTSGGVPCTAR